jgi:glycosyltransferase involved in cell wall biosynthesis
MTEPLKVLYFHQHFTTRQGAGGVRSYTIARRMVERGIDVTMVCGQLMRGQTGLERPFVRGRREGVVDGLRIVEFEMPYGNETSFARRAWLFLAYMARSAGLALTRRYDVAFATTTPLTAGIPAMTGRLLRWRPYVFEVRDLWPELPRAMGVIRNPLVLGALSVLEWTSYRMAKSCIGLAPGIVDGIAKRGVGRESIALCPNGSDLVNFTPQGPRASLPGIPDDAFVAAFTGTIGRANGCGAALDAAAELKKRGRGDLRILLLGAGGERDALASRAAADGLDNVVFQPPVPNAEIPAILRRADAGLQLLDDVPAFYFGTSPNKFFDYIAAGKPVLTNYPGWLAEMIAQEGCGIAVPPRRADLFAEALIRLADDPAARAEMGARARALAESRFDRVAIADQVIDRIAAAAGRSAPGATKGH